MQKSSKSLAAIVLGILILAGGYFGAYSQWQSLGEARAAFELSEQKNAELQKAQTDANAFIAKYENNREQAAKANRALPLGDADVPGILDNFSRMVAESGLNMTQINIVESGGSGDEAPAPSSIGTADIDVQMNGTYEAFNDLLLRTQRSLRLFDLVAINVGESQQDAASSAPQNFNFSLKFRTYFQQ